MIAGAIEGAVPPGLEAAVEPVLELIVYDATVLGGEQKAVVNLNTLVRCGGAAATTPASRFVLERASPSRVPTRASCRRCKRRRSPAPNRGRSALDARSAWAYQRLMFSRPTHHRVSEHVTTCPWLCDMGFAAKPLWALEARCLYAARSFIPGFVRKEPSP